MLELELDCEPIAIAGLAAAHLLEEVVNWLLKIGPLDGPMLADGPTLIDILVADWVGGAMLVFWGTLFTFLAWTPVWVLVLRWVVVKSVC